VAKANQVPRRNHPRIKKEIIKMRIRAQEIEIVLMRSETG
jgi:hypothetical protein